MSPKLSEFEKEQPLKLGDILVKGRLLKEDEYHKVVGRRINFRVPTIPEKINKVRPVQIITQQISSHGPIEKLHHYDLFRSKTRFHGIIREADITSE